MDYSRNSFIISRGFRNYFLFLISITVLEQLTSVIDMALLGNFVGSEAFAALNLSIPVESIFTGLMLLLTGGAGIIASRRIGNQDFQGARHVLTVSAVSAVCLAAILSVIGLFFLDSLIGFLCNDSQLYDHLRNYLSIYLLGMIPMSLYMIVALIVNIDGKPQVVLYSMIAACVIDIVLDILFMNVMGLGATGLGLATILSYVVSLLVLLPYIAGNRCFYKFNFPGSGIFNYLKNNLLSGMPYCLPYFVTSAILLVVNSATLTRLGTEALYSWGAGYQLLSLVIVAMNCIGGTILVTMGSMLVGCHDMDGLNILVHKCLNVSVTVTAVITFAVVIFPDSVLRIFGYDLPDGDVSASSWVCNVILFGFPYALTILKVYLCQTLQKTRLSLAMLISFFALSLGVFLAWSVFEPERMFLAFPVSGFLFVFADLMLCRFLSQSHKYMSSYFLIPESDGLQSRYLSVPYTKNGLDNALNELGEFLKSCELDERKRTNVNLCCEELMLSIVEKNSAKASDSKYFFDVFVLGDTDEVKVIVKDAGFPFNPIRKYENSAVEAMESGQDMDLSLRLLNNICKELDYNYMYGQNTIYMSFTK